MVRHVEDAHLKKETDPDKRADVQTHLDSLQQLYKKKIRKNAEQQQADQAQEPAQEEPTQVWFLVYLQYTSNI